MTSESPINGISGSTAESDYEHLGFAIDYPANHQSHKLTYEELHTLKVLISDTIHVLNDSKDNTDKIRNLVAYIDQFAAEGSAIYHIIKDHLPNGNDHNIVDKITRMLNEGSELSCAQYATDVRDALSQLLDREFQYITIHPKIMN